MVHKINSPFGGYHFFSDDPNNPFSQILDAKRSSQSEKSDELTPLVDVCENDVTYFARIVMPGVEKSDIQVKILNRTLTVNAEVKRGQHKDGQWVLRENKVGTYIRSVELPSPVDANGIEASYVNGVLNLTIPKMSGKHKSVSISVE